jgi:ribosomal-protein-alanine N-acetyltransferase
MKEYFSLEHHFRIQVMGVDDLDMILNLESSSFLTRWSKESFLSALMNPDGINLVGLRQDEIIGYLTSFVVLDEVYITNLLVTPDYRRKGVATELLRLLIKKFREMRWHHVLLEVREGNIAAINLYKKMNFRLVGNRKEYYADTKEDALVMNFSLNNE